jgi:tetratricopeptide (TPR) repeat protein
MGVFELKQKNLAEAIGNFNESVRKGNNKKIDGEAYLRLGEIYYDTLRDYELSQAYYDSAISALPQDYEGYAAIKARQEILNEFVKHLKTISWQDSLLTMAALDSSQLRASIDSAITKQKKLEEAKRGKKKRRSNRVEIVSNSNQSVFDSGENATQEESTSWYFGNPSAMALGQTEFARIWGNIKLEDNWRRSQRQTSASGGNVLPVDSASLTTSDPASVGEGVDPVDVEYSRLVKEIPYTDLAKQEALAKIEEAYFQLGDIYYFKLQEAKNATEAYTELLKRFPETLHEPEVLYTLYLIHKDNDPAKADEYATLLKNKHPTSTFARILINPDYLQESSLAAEKQKGLYKQAYEIYQMQAYDSADQVIDQALALGETSFRPSLDLLRILIIGKTEDISKYQFELDRFIKANEQHELAGYAKKLLETSREFVSTQEKRKGIQYIRSLEEPHYFVIVHKKAEKMDDTAAATLESFNKSYFNELNLKTGNLILNDEYALTFVSDLPGISTAIDYYKTFTEKQPSLSGFVNHKFDNFVITKDNFDIFYRTKGLDEYIQFFQKNYQIENQ